MNEILVITIYPSKGTFYDKAVGGAAHYIKRILSELKNFQFIVLAEERHGNAQVYQESEHIKVIRCWHQYSLLYWVDLCKQIWANKNAKKVLVNFEFNIYGGPVKFFPVNVLLFLIPLFLCKLTGKKIILIQHQMPANISDLFQHLSLPQNGLYMWLFNLIVRVYLWWLFGLASTVILFEEALRKRALKIRPHRAHKFIVIPHPIYGVKVSPSDTVQVKSPSRKNIMFFGYVTWYKGADWLVKQTLRKEWPNNYMVTIAGGLSVTAPNRKFYDRFLTLASKSNHVEHTGYISEDEIPKYFDEADIVILPYRVFMASSGPLATAIGYRKPFLISEELLPLTETADFAHALSETRLTKKDISFPLKPDDLFINKLHRAIGDRDFYIQLYKLSRLLFEARQVDKIAAQFEHIL